jgi:hypothetical protein
MWVKTLVINSDEPISVIGMSAVLLFLPLFTSEHLVNAGILLHSKLMKNFGQNIFEP